MFRFRLSPIESEKTRTRRKRFLTGAEMGTNELSWNDLGEYG